VKFKEKLKVPDDGFVVKNQKPDMNITRLALQNARAQIQKNQDSKIGKIKAFFSKSAQVLNDHNYLFELLPTGDKHTSVFTGAFSAIVKVSVVPLSRIKLIMKKKKKKATVIHNKIASEISDGFDEISDQVRSFYFVIKRHPESAYIRYHISLFYFDLFGFLICVMREWYQSSWKRLSRSLGNSFLENTIRGTLQKLNKHAKRIERETTYIFLHALGACFQQSLVGEARDRDRFEEVKEEIKGLKESIKTLPGEVAASMGRPLPTPMRIAKSHDKESLASSIKAMTTWSRDSILADIKHLEPYLQATHDAKLVGLSHSLEVSTQISVRVHKWVIGMSSEILWIEGSAGLSYPNQNTLTSAFMLEKLRRMAIPVMVNFIHYDCRSSWNPENELLKVVYALIHQAALIIPETIETQFTDLDFSTPRFKKLKEDVAALPEALELLADILTVGPALQFCIIDGLQLFDGRHMSILVRKSLRSLVSLLCKVVQDANRKQRVFKVLFTTEGFVGELAYSAGKTLLSRESYEDEDEILTFHGMDNMK
jgi:hypothetical protein